MTLSSGVESVRLEYDVVDVFTDTAFAGNPLAVVQGADGLDTRQLQAIAREFHLSETAFPLDPSEDELAGGATYKLRIFTPEAELPFAGHPSIGTAWLLAQQGRIAPGTVVQACGAGLLPLAVSPDGGPVELTGGTPTAGLPLDPAEHLGLLGLGHAHLDDVAPPRIVGTGLPYVVLPVPRLGPARVPPGRQPTARDRPAARHERRVRRRARPRRPGRPRADVRR